MTERLQVDRPERLIAFLRRQLPDWKRKTLEQRVQSGCVSVNGRPVTRNDPLAVGDEVLVGDPGLSPRDPPRGLEVLYEDEDLIAVHKPAGLLSVSTESEKERTALALVREWLSRPRRPAGLWPVHRLDRETSGVLLFSKSRAAQATVQERWAEARKLYLALVEGRPLPAQGVVDRPLFEDASLTVRVGEHPDARPARTRYSTLRELGRATLLEVELDTGRRHQIRAHLAWLGHPVLGDGRYGTKGPTLGLHARRLEVLHPRHGGRICIETPPPGAFEALVRASTR